LGILLATFGGGLGWLLILSGNNQFAGSLPLEYYSPETFGFLEVFGLPHLAVARGALLIALATFLTRQGIKSSVATGLWLLLAGIMQPLSALIGCFVILLGLIVEWLRILLKKKNINEAQIHSFRSLVLRAVIAVVIASPIIIYNILISFTDPFMRAWTIQNRILSPSPIHYVVAYILILPFAVFGIRRVVVNWEWKWGIILGWVITFPILAYFPHNLQRRLPEGVWVAWIVLGLAGLEGLKLRRQYSYLFALAFPSTLILFAGSLLQAVKPAEPIFVPREEAAAYVKMSNEFPTTQTVLAAYRTSNAIPAWAPVRVLIGHGPESIGLSNMQPLAEAFYRANTSDQQRQNFIVQNRINLIYWGPSERALGAWNPDSSPFLQLAFKINDISVFRVANLMTQRNQ
jgi:hypothetical protein